MTALALAAACSAQVNTHFTCALRGAIQHLLTSKRRSQMKPYLYEEKFSPEARAERRKLTSIRIGNTHKLYVALPAGGTPYVTTFDGDVVARPCDTHVDGLLITFRVGTRVFSGLLRRMESQFTLKRII
jgi:hypothetical protein